MSIIHGEANADYHTNPAVSHSKLAAFRRSPLLYHDKFIARQPEVTKKSRALSFGDAFDNMLLQPDLFQWSMFQPAEAEKAKRMQDRILSKPHLVKLIDQSEHQVVFRHSFGKFSVQCRPDMWLPDGCDFSPGVPTVVDLKTTANLGDNQGSKFQWDWRDYDYAGSVAFTQEVIALARNDARPVNYFFLVSEKSEPYDCMIFQGWEQDIEDARRKLMVDLAAIRRCFEEDRWPGCPDTPQTVFSPSSSSRQTFA